MTNGAAEPQPRSPYRRALIALGLGEWAFSPDGRHVRVARDLPLQLCLRLPDASAIGSAPALETAQPRSVPAVR